MNEKTPALANENIPLHQVIENAQKDKEVLWNYLTDTWAAIDELKSKLQPILADKVEPVMEELLVGKKKTISEVGAKVAEITDVEPLLNNIRALRAYINSIRHSVDL